MATSREPAPLLHSKRSALALYDLAVEDGELRVTSDSASLPFVSTEYSRFKYGDYAQAERYGSQIARLLASHFAERHASHGDEEIVVMGTPFKSVPNAAKLLADVARRELGASDAGFTVSGTRIYQHRLAAGDYGRLPSAMRDARNRQKKYFFDADDFEGKHVVLIDDVRITGSIERSVLRLLEHVGWESLTVASLLRLDPESARRNPQIEDALNHASVTSLADLLPLMRRDETFVLITRAVKRILEADADELRAFLSSLDPAQRTELHRAAVDDGYDAMDAYAGSVAMLAAFHPYPAR